jgi:hypothetical protein
MKHNEEIHDEEIIILVHAQQILYEEDAITDDEKIESIKKMSKISFLHLGWI